MDEEMKTEKMIIVCNHNDPGSVIPTLVFGASGASLEYKVFLFFTPGGAKALLKGELEKFQGLKGMPDPVRLYNDIIEMGGEVVMCELALEAKDIDPADARPGVVVKPVPPVLIAADGATMTFTF